MEDGLAIEFLIRSDLRGKVPEPLAASHAIPQWYRQMPTDAAGAAADPRAGGGAMTLKRCPPFLEAMTCGYIIPFPTDVTITVLASEVKIQVSGFQMPMVEAHMPHQFPGAPFPTTPVLKFLNPWIVRTPPGYSSLFAMPFNRFLGPIMPLAGIVETDTFYHEVHLPSLCLLPAGGSITLKRGDPLVQVIPFRRENWRSSRGNWEDERWFQAESQIKQQEHYYKEKHWVKKSFA